MLKEDVDVGKEYLQNGGTMPFKIISKYATYANVEYVGSGKKYSIPYNKILKEVKKGNKMVKYTLKQDCSVQYTLIGTATNGNAVMEAETGGLWSLPYSLIQKAVPYTISIQFKTSYKTYHYFSVEGDLELGDQLLVDGSLARVTGVDTRSERATIHIHGKKIHTTKILQPHER